MHDVQMLIGGQWRGAQGGATFERIDPVTGAWLRDTESAA